MSINFDSLPTNAPVSLMPDGNYPVTIKRAEMKTGPSGAYMSLVLDTGSGNVFDMISESDKPLARYKLGQFLRAIGVTPEGEFNLKDLVKLVPNKKLIAAIGHQDANNGYPARNIVNAFDEKIYYSVKDTTEAKQETPSADLPFTMDDQDGAEEY